MSPDRLSSTAFAHEPLLVFRDFDTFASINPVMKAPTLVLDDGTVRLDSTLILKLLDRIGPPDRRLSPEEPEAFLAAQRSIRLAPAACEKSVQIVYGTILRLPDKQHRPLLDHVERRLLAAYQT